MASRPRGDYRTLNSSWWDDPDVQRDLDPFARLTFAVLRTCKDYGIAGIYRYYLSTVRAQAGFKTDQGWTDGQVLLQFDALERAGYLAHDLERSVVWVIDGLRWDPHVNPGHTRQRSGIFAQLRSLPRTYLLLPFLEYYDLVDADGAEDLVARGRETVSNRVASDDQGVLDPSHRKASKDTGNPLILTLTPNLNLNLTPKAAEPPTLSPPAAATEREERDQSREEEATALLDDLVERADADEPGAGAFARYYFEAAELGLIDFYERRGGRWTPTRKRNLLSRMSSKRIRACLAAIELYVDKYSGTHGEDYLGGIAHRLDRDLKSDDGRKAFDRELEQNRRRSGGIFSQAMEDLNEREA